MSDPFWRGLRLWGAAFAVFTIIALSSSAQNYAGLRVRAPEHASWAIALVGTLPFWYAKLVLLPIVVIAGSRWPVSERPHIAVPLHLAISLLFAAVQLTLGMLVARALIPPPGSEGLRADLFNVFSTYLVTGAVFYWVFLGTFHAIDYARQLHAERLQASQLHAELAEARLQTLRSQLNPHFLFNALNAVAALCDRHAVEAASLMVARIGDLLRLALGRHDELTSLEQELHFVEVYLDIERIRIGPRLRIELDIPAELLHVRVPSMLLQPLVENAVRHGVNQRPGAAVIRISAALESAGLHLTVEDSGPGFAYPPAQGARNGVGVRNTVARLAHMYGRAHAFRVADSELGGACIEIVLPVSAIPARERTGSSI